MIGKNYCSEDCSFCSQSAFFDTGIDAIVVVLWLIGVDFLREGALAELFSECMSEVEDEFLRFGGVDKLPTGELCKLEMRPSEEELTVEEDLLILIPMFPTIALNDEEWRLPRLLLVSVTSSLVFP